MKCIICKVNEILEKEGNSLRVFIPDDDFRKSLFQFVRKEFFPRWDKGNNWILGEVKPPYMGRCDRSKKIIEVLYNMPHIQNSFVFLLIHEICHAVSTDYHGQRWRKRMLMASEVARRKGNKQLSRMILYDLEKLNRLGEDRKALP